MAGIRGAPVWLMVLALVVGCAARTDPGAAEVLTASPRASPVKFEVYRPDEDRPAPLVIVAHGFMRGPDNMRGWAEHLAAEGFFVVLPALPSWGNHQRNTNAIDQLLDHVLSDPATAPAIDPSRIGLLGFSHGGMITFLSAARRDDIDIWIGLDPVDRHNWARNAARGARFKVLALLAEPSQCNKESNWQHVEYPPSAEAVVRIVNGSVHGDPEGQSDGFADFMCGKSDESRRAVYFQYATAALRAALMQDERSKALMHDIDADPRLRQPGLTAR
jgi:hypothetical protein